MRGDLVKSYGLALEVNLFWAELCLGLWFFSFKLKEYSWYIER